jgi:hypothetical protein
MTWVHPDDVEKVRAAYDAALDPSEPKRRVTEFRTKGRTAKSDGLGPGGSLISIWRAPDESGGLRVSLAPLRT